MTTTINADRCAGLLERTRILAASGSADAAYRTAAQACNAAASLPEPVRDAVLETALAARDARAGGDGAWARLEVACVLAGRLLAGTDL